MFVPVSLLLGGKSLNKNLPKCMCFFLSNVTKPHPKSLQINNKYQGNFQGKLMMPVVAGMGAWGFTTFQLLLNVVSVRDLEPWAADKGGCSALHIISVWEFGTGKPSGSKFTLQPRFQNFKGSLPSQGRGSGSGRESSRDAPPSAFSAWLPCRGRKGQVYPDHYNWRALITKSLH